MRLGVISYDRTININEIMQLGDMAERLPFGSISIHKGNVYLMSFHLCLNIYHPIIRKI